MFQKKDQSKNQFMLKGRLSLKGYDWWWHNFTGIHETTGEEKSFFVEYYICNPAKGGKEPVFGQLPGQKKAPAYLMVKAGCWGKDARQLHRFFGTDAVRIRKKAPFELEAEDCYAAEDCIRGSVSVSEQESLSHPEYLSDAGEMRWELKVNKEIAFNAGYATSRLFRSFQAFEMFWHAEGMKTAFEGWVECDGERYLVDPARCFGYADKNWGSNFTSPWVWLSSSDIRSRLKEKQLSDTVFDIGGGRPKIGFLPLGRSVLGALYYEGREEEYNFSLFWKRSRTRFSIMETEEKIFWRILLENAHTVTEVVAECEKDQMLKIRYESPDGAMRHKELWNGGTGRARIRLFRKEEGYLVMEDDMDAAHVGCEFGVYSKKGEQK